MHHIFILDIKGLNLGPEAAVLGEIFRPFLICCFEIPAVFLKM